MQATVDLDAYFERIQWGGGTDASYETLAGVHDAHVSHVPFENIDVLLGRPPRLDLASLQDKLVRNRRGGYCFEHVTLFAAVLEQLGFHPVRHSARVTLFRPRAESPRTHMFLTLPLGEHRFVLDPGFGRLAPRAPLPLTEGVQTRVGEDMHEMLRDGHWWVLRAQSGDQAFDAWSSTLEQDNPVDFEMANHFTATHPSSPFVANLMLRAFTPGGRVTLMNRDLTIWRGSQPHASQLADRAALRAVLAEYFGFDLPEIGTLRVPSIPEWG